MKQTITIEVTYGSEREKDMAQRAIDQWLSDFARTFEQANPKNRMAFIFSKMDEYDWSTDEAIECK